MAQDTVKTRIFKDLHGNVFDSDHVTRRFFRVWLEGGYLGESHYLENKAYIKTLLEREGVGNPKTDKKMIDFAVRQFINYTAHDAGHCSFSHAQKCIVEFFKTQVPNPNEENLLYHFNMELLGDIQNCFSTEINEAYAKKEQA